MDTSRRTALKNIGKGFAAYSFMGLAACSSSTSSETTNTSAMKETAKKPFFKISLAQWSLNKSFFGKRGDDFVQRLMSDPDSVINGTLKPIDFPSIARKQFGIDAIEFVNTFYFGKAKDMTYLKDLKDRCNSEGVTPVLIMCDALGDLGDLDVKKRQAAVENHYQWVDAAKFLGCHAIRVNAAGKGTAEEVKDAAVAGLGALTEYGKQNDINIIVENHGGYSSDGSWLADVMSQVNNPYCGTLPDFGNFCLERGEGWKCVKEYDRYKGVKELMPYAKGVSAKTHDFDANGNEKHTDFVKMLQIVKDAGYTGYIDIEYEGSELSEVEGIKATKKLLERVGSQLA